MRSRDDNDVRGKEGVAQEKGKMKEIIKEYYFERKREELEWNDS